MEFLSLINAFNLAANLPMLVRCRLIFSLLSSCKSKTFNDDTTLICRLQNYNEMLEPKKGKGNLLAG